MIKYFMFSPKYNFLIYFDCYGHNEYRFSISYHDDIYDNDYKKIRNIIYEHIEKLFKEINHKLNLYTLVNDDSLYIKYNNCTIYDIFSTILIFDKIINNSLAFVIKDIKYTKYSITFSSIAPKYVCELIDNAKTEAKRLKDVEDYFSLTDDQIIDSIKIIIKYINENPKLLKNNLVKNILKNEYIKNELKHLIQANNFDLL